ncbi:MAG: exopolyphosphatase [Bacteroidia bacterium]
MRIAIIDLGTNTFHLLIAEIVGKECTILHKSNQPVRLGEDITKYNQIIPVAFERGINCLQDFKSLIDHFEVAVVKAIATSGVRSATNGKDFVTAAKKTVDINIDVIDGDTEATYIYKAVKWSGSITGPALIMDIGGGSTEFILCDRENLIWKKSYNIGAARLMQSFFNSDPINGTDQQAITNHLNEQLTELIEICKINKPQLLIGSAGAFESFAEMLDPELDLKSVSVVPIDYSDYRRLSSRIIHSSHKERVAMDKLIPLRVDMIVMATFLTNYILDQFKITEINLSTYDLKMGVLGAELEAMV